MFETYTRAAWSTVEVELEVDELLVVLLDVLDVVDELSSAYTADTIKSISRQLKIPSFHFMFFSFVSVFR
jgi:hypothetical protein